MKILWYLLIITAIFIFMFAHAGISQEWSQEISIVNGQSSDFDIDPVTGNLHMVCVQNGVGALYVKMDNSGKILFQEIIPGTENEQGGITFGPSIAIDPQGNPHVTYRIPEGGNYYSSYYTYKTETGWSSRIPLSIDMYRGWVVRVDVDSAGITHIARGSASNEQPAPMEGPVKYFKFQNNIPKGEVDNMTKYRCDDRIEIDASYKNHVHIILGCPNYPVEGGPVWYWRSFDGGAKWDAREIHHSRAKGANGSPDLFVDASGNVHIIYGSELDGTVGDEPSVRYSRWNSSGSSIRDVAVTTQGEIFERFDTPYGIGSVAASADGQIVIVAYSEDFGKRLFVRRSDNGGVSWGDRIKIADESVGSLGRNRHTIRAIKGNFYLLYPSPDGLKLKYLKLTVNKEPVANAGGPYTGNEGSPITFDASQSYDPDGTIVKYEWDFQNDGNYDQTTTNPVTTFTYRDDFNGQVKLRVTDNENATATDVKSVTVLNVPPTANAGGPYSGKINVPIQLNGSATDPGDDVLTFQWDLDNDGIYETNGQSPQVTFSTGGNHIVKLKVTDDDGGVGTDEAQVSIENKPPVVSAIPPQTIKEKESFDPIYLDNYVTDPDNPDEDITWTATGMVNLNVTITNRVATITVKDPQWNGSETITFKATDPGGLSDQTSTTFTVLEVNDPPVVSQIPNQTIDEGGTFNPINLDDYVHDPDHADSEMTWTATGQNQLIVTINQRVATIQTPDPHWFGSENITFKATDPGGLSDSKTATFKVNPVNDPPVVSKIPDQTIDRSQTFATFCLDDYVTDVDNLPSEMRWTHNAKQLIVNINSSTRVTSVAAPNSNWTGSETITFTATDPGGLSGSNSTTFTIGDFNQPPKVTQIPDQTIIENGTFSAIYLDYHVNDPDNEDSEIKWTWRGNKDLIFTEVNRILTVAVPDSEWAGTEIVAFKATDPGGKSDSCITIFKVIPINDPPRFINITDLHFHEDDTLVLTRSKLLSMVHDIDSPPEVLQFFILNMVRTRYHIDQVTKDMYIYADANWFGTETVLFKVFDDKGGYDSREINIVVQSVPDPPSEFALVAPMGTGFATKPDSIRFTWRRSYDPDPGEIPTYQLSISEQVFFNHVIDQYNNLKDTTFVVKPRYLEDKTYYWRVIAFDPTGRFTQCTNLGVFTIGTGSTDVNDLSVNRIDNYALFANYPNPFNPETRISFQLPKPCHVRLSVYNNLGQLIDVLFEGELGQGIHSKIWHGLDMTGNQVSSGVYLYRFETEEFIEVKKMLYIQ